MGAGWLPPIMLTGAGPEMVLSLSHFQVLAGWIPSCSMKDPACARGQ